MYLPYFTPAAQFPPGPKVKQIVVGFPIWIMSGLSGLLGSTQPPQGAGVAAAVDDGVGLGVGPCEKVKPNRDAITTSKRSDNMVIRLFSECRRVQEEQQLIDIIRYCTTIEIGQRYVVVCKIHSFAGDGAMCVPVVQRVGILSLLYVR